MSAQIKVRLTGVIDISIEHETSVDLEEFREWYEADGSTLDLNDVDEEWIIEFIKESPDTEFEFAAEFPVADPRKHTVLDFDITEAEILEVTT